MNPQWRGVLALCGAYSLATAVFNIAPLLIGVLITVLGLMEEQAGLLMTLELTAMSFVAFVLAPLGSRFSTRPAMLSSVLLAFAAHSLAANTESYSTLIGLRMVAGCSSGLLLLAVNTRIAASEEPVRLYGLVMVATTIVGAILLALIPTLVLNFGMAGAYGALSMMCLVLFPLIAMIPRASLNATSSIINRPMPLTISIPQISLLLGTVFLVQVTQSAFYSFSERFGVEIIGMSTEQMGLLLAIGYLGAIPGSALAAWLGYRYGRLSPLLLSLVLFAIAVNFAIFGNDVTVFSIAFIALNFFYFFCIPYQLGLAADLDATGKLAGATIGVFFFGLAGGPYLGGFLVSTDGYPALAVCVSVAVVLGMGIYSVLTRHHFAQTSTAPG